MLKHFIAAFTAITGLTACAHDTQPVLTRAVLESEADIAPLKTHLSVLLGRMDIELGADDPLIGPYVTVLPPRAGPLEGNNPALPTTYRLELHGDMCVLTDPHTGEASELPGVNCRPFDN